MTASPGATPIEWAAARELSVIDVLPVVSDTTAKISPNSAMQAIGKTPSAFNSEGFVVGIPKWTECISDSMRIERWSKEPRYGICMQTRNVHAIDIDIDDPVLAAEIAGVCEMVLEADLPLRTRPNSGKRLQVLRVELPEGAKPLTKRIIRTKDGLIEFLATGQQFIFAGTHTSGVRYEWRDGAPSVAPTVSLKDFESLWGILVLRYSVDGKSSTTTGGVAVGKRVASDANDPAVEWLSDKGLTLGSKDGVVYVRCPNEAEHSSDNGPTQAVYFPSGVGGRAAPGYRCLHAHCAHIHGTMFLEMVGFLEPMEFEDCSEEVYAGKTVANATATHEIVVEIPKALHTCTDQANAQRLLRQFGKRMVWSDQGWLVWDGRHWKFDETPVWRYAARLSAIIHAEIVALEAKATTTKEEADEKEVFLTALRRWGARSEMKDGNDRAIGELKRWVKIAPEKLDSVPWALNCLNGVVDLRTGELRPHDPLEYHTKLVMVEYHPDVVAPVWQSIVENVCLETGKPHKPLSKFLQRWFGYCATASVREQKFLVHYGVGSNGKSTVIDHISRVLGDYAKTAAPGILMASGSDRHPTEIADLRGARMVTSSESGEGGMLREDFVKQATGGDRLKGRMMRQDFFEFLPTHKLQLLTNHKPQIKGTDHGIWRRVLLMPYMAKWGNAEEVFEGVAHHLKSTEVVEALMGEGETQGILAWIVAGAVQWYVHGLQEPDAVRLASSEYRKEQDRVGQFLSECCELGQEFSDVLGGEWGGIYYAYREWCKEGGIMPLAKIKLLQELEQKVPHFAKSEVTKGGRGERRKTTLLIQGLKVLNQAE